MHINRPFATIIFFLLLIGSLYIYYIYLSIELGAENVEYAFLRDEIEEMKKKNSNLKEEVLTQMSLRAIEAKAIEQGLYSSDKFYILP